VTSQVALEQSYSAKDIGILKDLEGVRKRPSMYVGGKDAAGAFRIAKEIIDNSVDEHAAGFCSLIQIAYNTNTGFVLVADRGRGVPVDKHPETGISALTTVFTTLHAGGKFKEGVYKNSGGLHGVGASCTNALSDLFEVWSYQVPGPRAKPAWHYQKFSRGLPVTAVLKSDPPGGWAASRRGTIVRFHPDKEIFGTHLPDPARLFNETRDLAMLNPGLEIQLKINEKAARFKYDSGIVHMVCKEAEKDSLLAQPFRLYEKNCLDLALAWYDDDSVTVRSYVNSMYTSNGGTHVDGFRAALTRALREASGADFESKYWMMGLRVALHWRMQDPDYRSQTKEELSSDVSNDVRDLVFTKLALWLKQQPQLVKKLTERAGRFRKNEERFKADNKAVKNLELGGKDELAIDPSKFTQADSWVPAHMRELVLVEGDSAGGSALMAKAPHHEIIKLRGVGINAQQQSSGRVLANPEIKLIIRALGIRPRETDLSKMRTGCVTLLTDADQDGKHIASLLLAFFKVYYPEIIRQGKLRYINGPLYIGQLKDERRFGDTKEEVLEQFNPKQQGSVRLTRLKGWAEATAEQLEEIAFNPETRRLVVLSMNDEDELAIAKIMGDDVAHRKELLMSGGEEAAEAETED